MNIHAKPPAEPQEAPLYVRTDVTPETLFQAIGRLRQEAQDEIERLLAFLDATDGDADLEPTLGFTEVTAWQLQPSHPGVTDDREEDADHEDDAAFHDAGAAMAPKINQELDPRLQGGGQALADTAARDLAVAKRAQVRARKSHRKATGSLTHAR